MWLSDKKLEIPDLTLALYCAITKHLCVIVLFEYTLVIRPWVWRKIIFLHYFFIFMTLLFCIRKWKKDVLIV